MEQSLVRYLLLPNSDGWAMHEALGWVFVLPADSQGIWFWNEGFGWWTDSETFPIFIGIPPNRGCICTRVREDGIGV